MVCRDPPLGRVLSSVPCPVPPQMALLRGVCQASGLKWKDRLQCRLGMLWCPFRLWPHSSGQLGVTQCMDGALFLGVDCAPLEPEVG